MDSEQAPSGDDRRAREWRKRQTLGPSSSAIVEIRRTTPLPMMHPRRPVDLPAVRYDAAPTSRPAGRPDVAASSSPGGRPDAGASSTSSSGGRPGVEASKATTPIGDQPPADPFRAGMAEVLDRMGVPLEERANFEAMLDLFERMKG